MPCKRARQKAGSSASTSGVDSTSTSSGAPSSGDHGTNASSTEESRSAMISRLRALLPLSWTSSTDESSGLKGWYAVADSYCSQRTTNMRISAHSACSSSVRRDLPIPGSPTSSTNEPKPARTGATAAIKTARSRSRPTNGRRCSAGAASSPPTARTSSAEIRTWRSPASRRATYSSWSTIVVRRAASEAM